MLLVIKDGESKGPQKFTRLDAACDLGTVVLTKTTIPGYNGMDWSRHLVWLKGECVIALDRVTAQADGDYTLRCRWRSAGEAKLTENGLLVTQGGPRFHVLNADGSQQRLRSLFLDDTNHSLRTYPHANPRGETIVYDNVVERRFVAGESYTFQNLFYAAADKVRREYSLERMDDSTVRVTSLRGEMVVGVLKGDALFVLTGTRFSLAQATTLGDPPLFRADKPVDIEYDVATGHGTVVAKTPTRLTLLAALADGKLDGAAVKGDFRDGMVSLQIAAGRHSLAFGPSPEAAARMAGFAASFAPNPLKWPAPAREPLQGLAVAWQTRIADTSTEILHMALGDLGSGKMEIITASRDGTVAMLGLDGKVRWRQGGLVRADSVAIAKFDKKPHVVVGCHKPPYLYVFTAGGTRLEGDWAKVDASDPFKGLAAPLRYVSAADMDGDGSDEILAANFPNTDKAIMGYCYCFDKTGRMRWWRQPVNHELATATVAALKPGGPLAFLVGGTFNSCAGLNASGAECFNAFASHRLTVIRAADVDGDKANEVLIAGQDNYVHVHDADGKRRWMHNVGGAGSGLAVADVNGDGKPEIIATTAELNYNVFALTADGKRLWQAKAGEEANALAVGNVSDRPGVEIVVGTDGSEVLVLDGHGKRVAGASASAPIAQLVLCLSSQPGRSDLLAALKNGHVLRLSAGGQPGNR
jgi:outer membrane protein assembly factor BamB